MKWIVSNNKQNYLIYSWFIYKVITLSIYKVLGVGVKRIQLVSGFEIEIDLISKHIYPIIYYLKKHTLAQCKIVIDIICYDNIGKAYRFAIIYNLLTINYNTRFRLISRVNEYWTLLTVVGLFKSVNWSEREVFDFYGLFFIWNSDLRRILTDYGFNGYPLRKDFPLTGYIETYYNDSNKRINYKPLELSQEYRNFKLTSFWN